MAVAKINGGCNAQGGDVDINSNSCNHIGNCNRPNGPFFESTPSPTSSCLSSGSSCINDNDCCSDRCRGNNQRTCR